MAEIPHLYGRLVSNQGLEGQIQKLENQMKRLPPGSPEYEYDQLHLAREERELAIRKEHPNLDPMTRKGEEALEKIMDHDPELQKINDEIANLVHAYPSASTSWGIPMADTQDTKTFEVK